LNKTIDKISVTLNIRYRNKQMTVKKENIVQIWTVTITMNTKVKIKVDSPKLKCLTIVF